MLSDPPDKATARWGVGSKGANAAIEESKARNKAVSSIEAVTDKASPERSHLAQKAKDIGSAAVLLTRVFIALCWITAIVLAV